MQIAWCLAHYYGHVTELGQRLLQPTGGSARTAQAAVKPSRVRGVTAEVEAQRKRVIVPVRAESPPPDEAPAAPEAPQPRARSISGEIRVPVRRAPSIKPPLPEDSGPVITMEAEEPEDKADEPAPKPVPKRKRPAEPDPPELAARAGELRSKSDAREAVVVEEPRIVIADDLTDDPALIVRSGELRVREHRDRAPSPAVIAVELDDEPSAPVVIHSEAPEKSEPVLLERRRTSDAPTNVAIQAAPAADDADDDEVVELPPKPRTTTARPERNTQLGIGVVSAVTRAKHDTAVVDQVIDDLPTGNQRALDTDPTRVDTRAAPPGDYTSSSDEIVPPPLPERDEDTSPHALPPPPQAPSPGPSGQIKLDGVKRAPPRTDDDEDDDDRNTGPITTAMPAVPYDEDDEQWGPPGTTIPPALLGAMPGTITPARGIIPIPAVDDETPLMVAPPQAPETTRATSASDQGLLAALEDATAQMLELIRHLERAGERDQVVEAMMDHLAQSHRRAGFFAARGGELQLFAITPRPSSIPYVTLRLDRPSTLADVVGTRLPYRGPMHDESSRRFLEDALGVCPPEILLVPITVRERVVGVLFGEHRMRHTFDDQLALAARAAGNALERILKARRG
jgi:hypothetical protein